MPAEICQLCGMACCAEKEKFGYKRIVRINGIDNFMATSALCLTRQAGHTHTCTHKEGRVETEGGGRANVVSLRLWHAFNISCRGQRARGRVELGVSEGKLVMPLQLVF